MVVTAIIRIFLLRFNGKYLLLITWKEEPMIKSSKVFNFVTLGMDPEFELSLNGRYLNANEMFHDDDDDDDPDEYDERRDYYGENKYERHEGGFGADGSGGPLEIRPNASEDINQLIFNCRKLFYEFHEQYPNVNLSCYGNREPLGCHIHFGFDPEYCDMSSSNKSIFLDEMQIFAKVLDWAYGRQLMYLGNDVRIRSSYGKCSDIRDQDWGFEYRTLPSSVFYHPYVVTAILKISKWCATKFWNGDGIPLSEDCLNSSMASWSYFYGNDTILDKELGMLESFTYGFKAADADAKLIRAAWNVTCDPSRDREEQERINRAVVNRSDSDYTLRNNIIVTFNDEWSDLVKGQIIDNLANKHWNRRGACGSDPLHIVFFGLGAQRGDDLLQAGSLANVYSIPSRMNGHWTCYTGRVGSLSYSENKVWIGMSHNRRVVDSRLNEEMLESLMGSIYYAAWKYWGSFPPIPVNEADNAEVNEGNEEPPEDCPVEPTRAVRTERIGEGLSSCLNCSFLAPRVPLSRSVSMGLDEQVVNFNCTCGDSAYAGDVVYRSGEVPWLNVCDCFKPANDHNCSTCASFYTSGGTTQRCCRHGNLDNAPQDYHCDDWE